MAETLRAQIPMKSSVSNFFKGSIDANIYPTAVPKFYERIEILEGDGISEGSIYFVHMGKEVPFASIVKVKVVEIDYANKKARYEFLGGDLLNNYKTYKVGINVIPKEDGEGSLVNWFCEYEKRTPEIPDPTFHRDAIFKIFEEIDAYLLKA